MTNDKIPVYRDKRPKTKSNVRALSLLALFFAIVMIILFLRSPISKISVIEVKGNQLVSVEQVIKASGLRYGTSFFTWKRKEVIGGIEQLSPVKEVSVESSFPGKITINVEEHRRVAYLWNDEANRLIPLLSNGQMLEIPYERPLLIDRPIVRGELNESMKKTLYVQLEQTSDIVLARLSEIIPDPSRSYPDKIKIYTRDGYLIYTTANNLASNLAFYHNYVLQNKGQAPGILTLLDAKYFKDYDAENTAQD